MTQVHSFSPLVQNHCTKIILGSMPGKASLSANQYYAHPGNCFWRFVETLLGIPRSADYASRCNELTQHNIALWDVLKACTRSGSLDSNIIESSIVPNDFESFFDRHRNIASIYFNGAKAEKIYHRYVLPKLPLEFSNIPAIRLPSTSPANASIPVARKLEQWSVIAR